MLLQLRIAMTFSFIRDFTHFENDCYWQISDPPRMTVCRISLQIIHNGRVIQSIEEMSENDDYHHIHAEVIVIAKIIARLKSELWYVPFMGHTEIDLFIKLNNSSCVDCQNSLADTIFILENIIGGKLINLHLFFSHLYRGQLVTMKQAIEVYSGWISYFVERGITVRLYPIIVLNMVERRFDLTPWDLDTSYYCDKSLIDHLIDLCDRIHYNTSHNIFLNFNDFYELLSIQSWHNLKYIRISPS